MNWQSRHVTGKFVGNRFAGSRQKRDMTHTEAEVGVDPVAVLYDRHASQVYRYCARRVGPSLAEDLVADVFMIVQRRRDRIEAGQAALPWLYGIATNLLRAHRRAEVRAYRALERTGVDPLGGATGIADGHDTRAAERVDAAVSARRLAGALARLPRTQRDVLLLFAIGELSYAEIAQALDIPLGSVQSSLYRARARLRSALDIHSGGSR
jgi:RNA polymerase sigma-70 factor (ECF subfamily)